MVCECVCVLVTTVNRAKTAEPIKMAFGGKLILIMVQGTIYYVRQSICEPSGKYD